MPPTMIASIYGMNFKLMPELDWTWGYPAALVLMVASSVAAYATGCAKHVEEEVSGVNVVTANPNANKTIGDNETQITVLGSEALKGQIASGAVAPALVLPSVMLAAGWKPVTASQSAVIEYGIGLVTGAVPLYGVVTVSPE